AARAGEGTTGTSARHRAPAASSRATKPTRWSFTDLAIAFHTAWISADPRTAAVTVRERPRMPDVTQAPITSPRARQHATAWPRTRGRRRRHHLLGRDTTDRGGEASTRARRGARG